MPRPFLFGGSSSGQSESKYLVEFRAGKMTMKGKIVHPDKRKGTVYVHQTDDSLMHFCWKDRTTGLVEDELIIFPDDAEFKRVPQCTTGRVYVLKFKSSSRRCFYWLQEPKTEKDEDYCSKVNEFLNNPPVPGSGHGGGLGLSGSSGGGLQSDLSTLGDGELQNLLNNMSQQQLVQLLGGVSGNSVVANLSSLLAAARSSSSSSSTPSSGNNASSVSNAPTPPPRSAASDTSTTTTAEKSKASPSPTTPIPVATTTAPSTTPSASTTTSTPSAVASSGAAVTSSGAAAALSGSQIQLSDLQNILSGLNVPAGQESQAGSSAAAVDLSTAITAEALAPLLNNSALMERVQSLLPSAPDSPKGSTGADQVKNTVQSPQFQQALSMFSAALQSGQLGPLMLQFGLGEEVVTAANSGDMDAFVRALQSAQGNKDKKDDEEMSLD